MGGASVPTSGYAGLPYSSYAPYNPNTPPPGGPSTVPVAPAPYGYQNVTTPGYYNGTQWVPQSTTFAQDPSVVAQREATLTTQQEADRQRQLDYTQQQQLSQQAYVTQQQAAQAQLLRQLDALSQTRQINASPTGGTGGGLNVPMPSSFAMPSSTTSSSSFGTPQMLGGGLPPMPSSSGSWQPPSLAGAPKLPAMPSSSWSPSALPSFATPSFSAAYQMAVPLTTQQSSTFELPPVTTREVQDLGPMQMPDATAANAAGFGAAKDAIAQQGQGAMQGLRDAMEARGIGGSGIEAQGTMNVLGGMQSELGQTSRDIAQANYDAQQRFTLANAQNALTQRGQDIGQNQNLTQSELEQRQQLIGLRGQDLSQQMGYAGLNLQAVEAQQQAMLTGRGQDINAFLGSQGQQLSWAEAQQQAALQGRGQDLSYIQSLMSNQTALSGQSLSWAEAQMQAQLAGRGQDLSYIQSLMSNQTAQQGQMLSYQEAQQQAALQGRGQDMNYIISLMGLRNAMNTSTSSIMGSVA